MPRLPRAPGNKHITAFRRDGWFVDHIEGSHHILVKEGCDVHLSIPVHKGKDLDTGLLKKFIRLAGLTNEKYLNLFYKRRKGRD